ncbi:MAG: hypothetical protein HY775_08925 [Acidobacteria bacterium]|nr:hypothetical protein [Acidobacteriota bacterium]
MLVAVAATLAAAVVGPGSALAHRRDAENYIGDGIGPVCTEEFGVGDVCYGGAVFDVSAVAGGSVSAVIAIEDDVYGPTGGFYWFTGSTYNLPGSAAFCGTSDPVQIPEGVSALRVELYSPPPGQTDCLRPGPGTTGIITVDYFTGGSGE